MSASTTLSLKGCSPVPLAHYLKALGILRLVSQQRDATAAGQWHHDAFVLTSSLDSSALLDFFLSGYRPTPVLAPWNGGSGFFPKDNAEALIAIETGLAERMEPYRCAIGVARQALREVGLKEKPTPETKEALLLGCRNMLPDDVLWWLDAAFVLSGDGAKYPPLLGTGGNDGRLEFTNNFMQRLVEVMDPVTGKATPSSDKWLRRALFAESVAAALAKAPVGQFFPGAAGGANATSGFDAVSAVNPWDYILMIEGALLFAAASVKRLEIADSGQMICPFCVRQAGVGYASASPADETGARPEMWLPLWNQPTTLAELQTVFSEGRAQVGDRPARNGVDFARAVVTLGVDRGLSAFQRYGFQVRNGLAYFATPLDRVAVRRNAHVDLLADVDWWLDQVRRNAGPAAPASVSRALTQLESRILDLCRQQEGAESTHAALPLQAVLIALGKCEKAIARGLRWATETARLRPLSRLSPKWLSAAYANSSAEMAATFRLAAALVSLGPKSAGSDDCLALRCHLEPVELTKRGEFKWREISSNDVVWSEGAVTRFLNATIARRLVQAEQSTPAAFHGIASCLASLSDVTAFLDGDTDDELFADLLWGLSLLDWQKVKSEDVPWSRTEQNKAAPSFYALMKLCFVPSRSGETTVPLAPAIHRRAVAGDGQSASQLAVRRLRGSGYWPAVDKIALSGEAVTRAAAALLFPLEKGDVEQLRDAVLRKPQLT
jgi:CRISPR-associated protein Csx17